MNQLEFLFEFLKSKPNQRFTPEQLREKVASEYQLRFDSSFKDVNKAARTLARRGRIQREPEKKANHYWFDAQLEIIPEEFDELEVNQIFERDNFACVNCKRGPADGVKISVGYAKSVMRGGKFDLSNGRTLCPMHRWILETAQESEEARHNWRKLLGKLPKIGESARAQKFWDELVELMKKHGVDPSE